MGTEYLITGATGYLGRRVVARLLARLGARSIGSVELLRFGGWRGWRAHGAARLCGPGSVSLRGAERQPA